MKNPIVTAAIIAVVILLWLLSGEIVGNGTGESKGSVETAVPMTSAVMAVEVTRMRAKPYRGAIVIRGRTESVRTIDLKAEVDGRVIDTPVEEGATVTEGELICALDPRDKSAAVAHANALVAQRELEFSASDELARKGHRSETQVASARALLDQAKAQLVRAEVELSNTLIKAPFDGTVDLRPAEIGAYLQKGGICARLMYEKEFAVVGEVSEILVDALRVGAPAHVQLTNGRELTGTIHYVAKIANVDTRTFRVEVRVPNPDRALREGLTADIVVPGREQLAHAIRPSLIVMNDQGKVGLRAVDGDTVIFYAIRVIGDERAIMWVTGLPEDVALITTGQGFVATGQRVKPVYADEAGQ